MHAKLGRDRLDLAGAVEPGAQRLRQARARAVGELRELFGTRLEDPEARFELSLALRVG